MTDLLSPGTAAANGGSLAQHLLPCPGCGQPAAAHIGFEQGEPTAVRVVCAAGCADNDSLRVAAIDALYPSADVA